MSKSTELEVVRSELGGWDVRRPDDDGLALTHHDKREEAVRAAELRVLEEGGDRSDVVVRPDEVEGLGDESIGVRFAVGSLTALLTFVTLLIVVIALIGALTGFGS